jgi:hypothetical protein
MTQSSAKMPAAARVKHDSRGIPVRLGGKLRKLALDDRGLRNIPVPDEKPVLTCDWEGMATFCKFTTAETEYFLATRRDGLRYQELGLTLRERETIRRGINYKLARYRRHLDRFFKYVDSKDFYPILKKPTTRSESEDSMSAVEPLNKTEISWLRKKVLKIAQADSQVDRRILLRELAEARIYNRYENAIIGKLRQSAPAIIEATRLRLVDERDGLLKRAPDVEQRTIRPGNAAVHPVVEIWSDGPSISRRIVALSRILQILDNTLTVEVVNEVDAEVRIADLQASLPVITLEKVELKGPFAPQIEVIKRDAEGREYIEALR